MLEGANRSVVQWPGEDSMTLHIVLLEPEIPQNSGNIARTCAATGATLHLIHPLGFSLADRYLKRAGLDYWAQLTLIEWPSWQEFWEAKQNESLWFFTTKGENLYSQTDFPAESYFIFGNETQGIREEILAQHQRHCLRIPMQAQSRSLNLSNSVAIAAYEYLRQNNFATLKREGKLHRLQYLSNKEVGA